MKRLISVLFIFLLLLSSCSAKSGVKQIKLDEFETMLNNKEEVVYVIGLVGCPACIEYKPVLEKVTKEHELDVYYVDIDRSTWAESEIERLAEIIKENFNFDLTQTPTTIFVTEGYVAYPKMGFFEEDVLVSLLKGYNIVK